MSNLGKLQTDTKNGSVPFLAETNETESSSGAAEGRWVQQRRRPEQEPKVFLVVLP